VEEWRRRDPIVGFGKRLAEEKVISEKQQKELDEAAIATVDEAVRFADESPLPDLDSLYDDLYVYGDQLQGWWTVDERAPEAHRGEDERGQGDVARGLREAGAAYAGTERQKTRGQREGQSGGDGEGEPAGDVRDEEGGGQ